MAMCSITALPGYQAECNRLGVFISPDYSVGVTVTQPRAGVHYPRSTGEFQSWFSNDADCLDYLAWLRWPQGLASSTGQRNDPRGVAVES